jgi:hypothetical protein
MLEKLEDKVLATGIFLGMSKAVGFSFGILRRNAPLVVANC